MTMNRNEIANTLRQGMLFQRLSPEDLERVARNAVGLQLSEGESLFEQQDAADRFYMLVSGQIKLYRLSSDGSEKVIEVIHPGATFAEALMFMQKPSYPVGAQALKSSSLISVDSRDFVAMLRQSVDTLLLLAADLSQRLHGMITELNDLSIHTGTCRVANYFLNHTFKESNQFVLDIPKQVLASRLSIKPETLSRIFRDLSNTGLIEMQGNEIKILNRSHLSDIADTCTKNDTSLLSTFYQRVS